MPELVLVLVLELLLPGCHAYVNGEDGPTPTWQFETAKSPVNTIEAVFDVSNRVAKEACKVLPNCATLIGCER